MFFKLIRPRQESCLICFLPFSSSHQPALSRPGLPRQRLFNLISFLERNWNQELESGREEWDSGDDRPSQWTGPGKAAASWALHFSVSEPAGLCPPPYPRPSHAKAHPQAHETVVNGGLLWIRSLIFTFSNWNAVCLGGVEVEAS